MKLVLFDIDGMLVNSQYEIVEVMNLGLCDVGLLEMLLQEILLIVGLLLFVVVVILLFYVDLVLYDWVVQGYCDVFVILCVVGQVLLFYFGVLDCLDVLVV